MAKTRIVYWSPFGPLEDIPLMLLQSTELKPFLSDLRERQKISGRESHFMCPCVRDKHRNTFIGYFNYDVDVSFFNNELFTQTPTINQRPGVYPNSFAFGISGFFRIFFSETPLLMETSPAYYHQTSYSHLGHVPSGQFDINQWFRPSAPTFQCFPNVNRFQAQQNEPLMYFNFESTEKIELRQFVLTKKLLDIASGCVSLKNTHPRLPLTDMYRRFNQTTLSRVILKEIKANLI